MSCQQTVLVIDDDRGMNRVLAQLLSRSYSVHTALSGEEGLKKAFALRPDLILLDLEMPELNGLAVLKRLRQAGEDLPVIILTAFGRVNSAVQAMKLGAIDYLEKPFDNEKLMQEVARAFAGRKTLKKLPGTEAIIGESPQMRKVWQLIEKFGPTDIPILLQGETGTGKELFARAIHELSKRSQGPFVPIDCAALPQSLVESELFGYERGAFTGADRPKPGLMELARGGTVLLDEVGNFPVSYQVKLLRCIQEREFLPLGARSVHIKPLDVRFISATNVNLREGVKKGAFREDLYYRLNGITVDIPPLREREGDVELLVHHFIRKYGTIYGKPVLEVSDQAMELFTSYPWPGNVRELEHTVRMAIISANGVVLPRHLPPYLERFREAEDQKEFVLKFGFYGDVGRPVDLKKIKAAAAAQAERQVICELTEKVHLKKGALAKLLGIDAKTLRAKLKEIEDDQSHS